MTENQQDSFLREIDEELRNERYAKLWKRYGAHLIGVALVIIGAVAGYQGWRAYDINMRNKTGEQFAKAQNLASENKGQEADAAFSRLAADASSGYSMLARFRKATLQAFKSGDATGFSQLAGDAGIDAAYSDLAKVIGVMHETGGADPKKLMERLAPLTADNNPWRYSAREITAVLAINAGDAVKARELLKSLADDATTPRAMRQRASELLAVVGS